MPKIIHKVVADAIEGNVSSSKLLLEIAGMKEAAQPPADAGDESSGGIGPLLDLSMLESMREQIAAMPDLPEPSARK